MRGTPFIIMSAKQRIVGFVLAFLLCAVGGYLFGAGIVTAIDIYRCGWQIQALEFYALGAVCLLMGGLTGAVGILLWRMCWKGRG